MKGGNRAASVRQKLTNRSKERGEDFQLLLLRYANDRVLYRLSQSRHRDRFVLKGATLFSIWSSDLHRATRDVDLLGLGTITEPYLQEVFSDLMALGVDDGLTFDGASLAVGPIRKGQTYGGLRVSLQAKLGTARLNLQFDVGLGDAYQGQETELPPLLDQPSARLRAYERETVIAEKVEATVTLGLANSRMKDFYDLATLAEAYSFEGKLVVDALRGTFQRRRTELPKTGIADLMTALRGEVAKPIQWKAFVAKASPRRPWTFEETLARVQAFVQEPLVAAASGAEFDRTWPPQGPWQ